MFVCFVVDNDGYNANWGRGGGMRGRGNWGYRGDSHLFFFVYILFGCGIDIITEILSGRTPKCQVCHLFLSEG